MKVFFRILTFSLFTSSFLLFAQETPSVNDISTPPTEASAENSEEPENKIPHDPSVLESDTVRQTLYFGTERAAAKKIGVLIETETEGYDTLILERMRTSKNEALISNGFSYFRKIQSTKALSFSIDTLLKNFRDYPQKGIQFSIFYLTDMKDQLSEEQRNFILEASLDIVDHQGLALVQPVLALVSSFYISPLEEEKLAYRNATTIQAEQKISATPSLPRDRIGTEGGEVSHTDGVSETPDLFSKRLYDLFETISVASIRDDIVETLGTIQAYGTFPFIAKRARDTELSQSHRRIAILALGNFVLEDPDFEDLEKERSLLFEELRKDPVPALRAATISAISFVPNTEETEEDEEVPPFFVQMRNALRDDSDIVREAALSKIKNVLSTKNAPSSLETLFQAVAYLSMHDSSEKIKGEATKTLTVFPSDMGKDIILKNIRNLSAFTHSTRAYIEAALTTYAEDGGIQALVELVQKYAQAPAYSEKHAMLQFIAKRLAAEKNPHILPLVESLIAHPDVEIQTQVLNAIAKNNLIRFEDAVREKSEDIHLPTELRSRARRTLEILIHTD